MKAYDVHFALTGYYGVEADSKEQAEEEAAAILAELIHPAEKVVMTALGAEIQKTLESAVQDVWEEDNSFYVYYDDTDGNPHRTDTTHEEDAAHSIASQLKLAGYVNIEVVSKADADALGPETGEEMDPHNKEEPACQPSR